jgi:hypothetical protein
MHELMLIKNGPHVQVLLWPQSVRPTVPVSGAQSLVVRQAESLARESLVLEPKGYDRRRRSAISPGRTLRG